MKAPPSFWTALILLASALVATPSAMAGLPAKEPPSTGPQMLSYDEMRTLTAIAQKIEIMMTVALPVRALVWPQGVRDPDGSLGLFVACSHPFITPAQTPGMDARKTWVMLAVFAVVKHTEGSPVPIDYMGFTDAAGMSHERWFYKLDMSTARLVQHQLATRTITMEQGYDKIVAAWHRVTSAD